MISKEDYLEETLNNAYNQSKTLKSMLEFKPNPSPVRIGNEIEKLSEIINSKEYRQLLDGLAGFRSFIKRYYTKVYISGKLDTFFQEEVDFEVISYLLSKKLIDENDKESAHTKNLTSEEFKKNIGIYFEYLEKIKTGEMDKEMNKIMEIN